MLIDRDLASVADAGVGLQFFLDTDHRNAFRAILEHQAEYQSVPSEEVFRRDFPTYRLTDAPDTMDYYLDTIRADYKKFLLDEGLDRALQKYDEADYEETQKELMKLLGNINSEISSSRIVDLTETGDKRLERYKAYRKRDGSLRGISSGFKCIDIMTQGFQPGQLITFVGPPAAGKSTLMLLADMAAHRSIYKPFFVGFEMSNEEQEERYDAIRAGVSHTRLRNGRLKPEEMEKLERAMRRTTLLPPMMFSEDASSTTTVSGIAAQLDRYQPDAVYIDGSYMMDDDFGEKKGSAQALTNITRGLKRMAQSYRIPVINSTQVLLWKMDRKKGVTEGSIGYSSSFLQDSDAVVAVENTDDPDLKKLKSLKSRNAPGFEAFINWDWDTGTFEELEDPEKRVDDNPATF